MTTALEQSAPSRAVVTKLELPTLPDDMLCEYRGAVAEQVDDLKSIQHAIDLEIERRLRDRGGRELAHPKFDKIALEEQYSPYVADYPVLKEAQRLLREDGKDEDAAKVVKHVAEQVTVVAAHDEYGSPVSIAALIRKYGPTSHVGQLLSVGLTRVKTGERLVVKAKPITRTIICTSCRKATPVDGGSCTTAGDWICYKCDDLADEARCEAVRA